MKTLILTCIITMISATAYASPNLVVNGGFEEWTSAPSPPADTKAPFPKFGPDGAPANWRIVAEITPGITDPAVVSQVRVYRDQTVKHGGMSSLRLDTTSFTDIEGAVTQIPVDSNSRYKIRCWIKADNIQSPRGDGIVLWTRYGPNANFWKNNVWSVQSPPAETGTFDWQPFEFTVVTNAIAETMDITLQIRNASGKVWFDDVEMTKIGIVTPVESY